MFQWLACEVTIVSRTLLLSAGPPSRVVTQGSELAAGIVVAPRQLGIRTPFRNIWNVVSSCPGGSKDRSIVKTSLMGLAAAAITSVPSAPVMVMFTCWLRYV